mmetsp:Transcript_10842/g.24848  ORF Transcript_10842/g.24848 Transcript_10842/m.24848 type:complete len:265 (-) Transcript_10842:1674-2468(-)
MPPSSGVRETVRCTSSFGTEPNRGGAASPRRVLPLPGWAALLSPVAARAYTGIRGAFTIDLKRAWSSSVIVEVPRKSARCWPSWMRMALSTCLCSLRSRPRISFPRCLTNLRYCRRRRLSSAGLMASLSESVPSSPWPGRAEDVACAVLPTAGTASALSTSANCPSDTMVLDSILSSNDSAHPSKLTAMPCSSFADACTSVSDASPCSEDGLLLCASPAAGGVPCNDSCCGLATSVSNTSSSSLIKIRRSRRFRMKRKYRTPSI